MGFRLTPVPIEVGAGIWMKHGARGGGFQLTARDGSVYEGLKKRYGLGDEWGRRHLDGISRQSTLLCLW
ncbi:MAG TPA: hypothetical protein VNP04_20235 [Alphaproteobacteria bacterium]|nr:hypothetical protein [Alphaproteobacteria bacterium]